MARYAVNAVGFQVGWFASVLAAARGHGWVGPAVVAVLVGIHLTSTPGWRREVRLAVVVAAAGLVFDSLFLSAGVYEVAANSGPPGLSPPWLVGMWVNFGIVLNSSMRWLHGRHALAATLGAIGGPASYAAGERLGALVVEIGWAPAVLLLAPAWAAVTLLLVWLAPRVGGATPRAGED